ncbi:MAG: hypothetical protein KDD44_05650, partial [Bdellovibrionales bacterium]|nr:hypothetical protein [Bdellovibrionales bacterium]
RANGSYEPHELTASSGLRAEPSVITNSGTVGGALVGSQGSDAVIWENDGADLHRVAAQGLPSGCQLDRVADMNERGGLLVEATCGPLIRQLLILRRTN